VAKCCWLSERLPLFEKLHAELRNTPRYPAGARAPRTTRRALSQNGLPEPLVRMLDLTGHPKWLHEIPKRGLDKIVIAIFIEYSADTAGE
jgi:hypothetical protein